MDSDRDVLMAGMGPTAVISRQQYTCSIRKSHMLDCWLGCFRATLTAPSTGHVSLKYPSEASAV